ncbi:hypothetical protein DUI87_10587 [Hirundo rustica rustica]|uniref:Uncharacterized protein n=1 Tax=Hirundo rustica rustica TaxID=333673 RepID=A0A3M0L0Z3_HIRRU|nr:hypothetical protein DUI87_10587 [Hirundo rustica rustica]
MFVSDTSPQPSSTFILPRKRGLEMTEYINNEIKENFRIDTKDIQERTIARIFADQIHTRDPHTTGLVNPSCAPDCEPVIASKAELLHSTDDVEINVPYAGRAEAEVGAARAPEHWSPSVTAVREKGVMTQLSSKNFEGDSAGSLAKVKLKTLVKKVFLTAGVVTIDYNSEQVFWRIKMSHFTSEDEALLQSMLRQLLQSVKEKITGAPSVECAEEILLHLEETDENFHNYEFVKYLRQYIKNTVGPVIEEETEKCTSAQNQGEISGYDTLVQHLTKKTRESKEYREMMHALKTVMMVVVESLINKFEEDRMHDKELASKAKKERQGGYYTDNCSDSDSSFNQSYAFMSQEQLQLLAERLDPSQPKEVRQEALQTLCLAPASDILSSESWPSLRKHLTISLADPDATYSEKILRFYAKTFSSSPFNMTKEVYTSLARHLELYFLSGEYSLHISSGLDVSNSDVNRLLKKVRLLNEYQKEAPSSWIRHPEKYMEEVVESTLSLLSLKHKTSHPASPDLLSPMHFMALLDIKAVWFKKWTVYINCLETTLLDVADILARIAASEDGLSLLLYGENEKTAIDSPTAAHVLVQFTKKLLHDDISLLSGSELMPDVKGAFIFVCRQMYRTCEGLQVLIPYGLHESIAEAWRKTSLLSERVPTPVSDADSTSSISQESKASLLWEETLLDALLNFSTTPKGLFLLHSTGAMNDCVNFMFNSLSKKIQTNEYEDFGDRIIVTQMATTPMAAVALQNSGFIKALVTELWALLECGKDDLRITQPKSIPTDPIDQSCQKDIIDRLIILNSEAKIHSLFNYEQSHIFGLRLLNVLCCELNTLLLLETQYKVSQVLLTAQEENVTETSEGPGVFIIDGLSVERNHVLVRINMIGGPQERILPLRELDKGSGLYPWPMFSSFPVPKCYLAEIPRKTEFRQDKDLDKLLKLLKSPDKPTRWAEICRKQFCKVMKTRPDSIGGPTTDADVKKENLSSVQQLGVEMTVRHLQHDILKHTEARDLQVFLKEEALHGFRVSDYLDYMEILEKIYRPMLLKDMRTIGAQNT